MHVDPVRYQLAVKEAERVTNEYMDTFKQAYRGGLVQEGPTIYEAATLAVLNAYLLDETPVDREAIIEAAIDAQLTNTDSWWEWLLEHAAEWLAQNPDLTRGTIRDLCREDVALILDAVGYWDLVRRNAELKREGDEDVARLDQLWRMEVGSEFL